MDETEFMLRARSLLQRTKRGMEDVSNTLQQILSDDDDAVLSQQYIDGGPMETKSILTEQRELVARLEGEVNQAYALKLRRERAAREWKAGRVDNSQGQFQDSLSVRRLMRKERTATGNQILPKPPRPPREDVQITPEVRRWIKLHAPDRLPEQQPQELTPAQAAMEANSDYCAKCYQLQRARASLATLEKKIRDARELAQCYAEVA